MHVSGGDSTVSEPIANVVGGGVIPRISPDGSHVHFIAGGVLTTNPNHFGQAAQPGADNLYVFERDAQHPSGRTAFIATLSGDASEIENGGLWNGTFNTSGANVTPDGQFFLFTSHTDLTPDDTSTTQQVFVYDAQTETLTRVSVGNEGYNDDGNTDVADAEIVNPSEDGFSYGPTNIIYRPGVYATSRSISANGEYIFFQSTDGLTPEAYNHEAIGTSTDYFKELAYAMNVYEYHNGVVSLISDGRDITSQLPDGANVTVKLTGTDESGRDVFFETADSLVPQDTDSDLDVYDARIDGGFPPPPPPASCSGEACQGALTEPPTLLSPGSEFQAGGNPPLESSSPTKPVAAKSKSKPKKCNKASMLKRGKCVKRKAKKSTHGKARR